MEKTWFLYLTAVFLAQYCFLACFTMNVSSFATDQSALLAFKVHITFDNPHHILANNWSSATSVCDWIGVSCGKRHHRVVALNLPAMGIGGTISPHIGNLSFLSYFNITNNTFQGHLPGELARLHLLNVVDFNFNNFSGGVPTWFGNLPKLQYLCLASNSFTGLVPPSIGNISTLVSLDLRSNFLEGGVPEEIGYLNKLKWLQMGFNNLSGSIPLTIFNISSLQRIEFRHNMLSGILPEHLCVFLPKLEFLRLSLNEFDGQIPTTLGECRELQFLSLAFNKFSGFIPKGIGNLTLLRILYLDNNNFTGEIPREIGNCTTLSEVDLSANNLSEYGLEGLVSTKCDVYSYGIMLMETFTRSKPIDARFDGDLSLKCWVANALPNAIVQVLDANLLRQNIEHNNAKVQCVSSLMQLALNCSEDSPKERMIMKDVLVAIKNIKLRYVENCK